jgi:hypothetical protein
MRRTVTIDSPLNEQAVVAGRPHRGHPRVATYLRRRGGTLHDVHRTFWATAMIATATAALFLGLLAGVGLAGDFAGPMRDEAIKARLHSGRPRSAFNCAHGSAPGARSPLSSPS